MGFFTLFLWSFSWFAPLKITSIQEILKKWSLPDKMLYVLDKIQIYSSKNNASFKTYTVLSNFSSLDAIFLL